MKVTDVKIRMSKGSSKIKAFAVVTFDEILEVHSFKVVEGENGLFVGMPSQRGQGDKFYNTVWIKDENFKNEVTEQVLGKYNEMPPAGETQIFEEPE
ncbi:MAG: SpoVG family protein [bacterium]